MDLENNAETEPSNVVIPPASAPATASAPAPATASAPAPAPATASAPASATASAPTPATASAPAPATNSLRTNGNTSEQQNAKISSNKLPAKLKLKTVEVANEEMNVKILSLKNNPLYNISNILDRLNEYPTLKIRREGKYYMSTKNSVIEKHEILKPRNNKGEVIPIIHKEVLSPLESIFSQFCEDYLCISRANTLPLSSQGERHLIWVSRIKANHIIKHLKGNGCYIVNRFPGDVFLKDKQVMGATLREYMLERQNRCYWRCGTVNVPLADEDDEKDKTNITYRICMHMVESMRIDKEGCTDENCFNFEKRVCRHLDVFIPEVQSFCLYNALQDFSNRLNGDLKGQLFICKPSYLYKGLGFRFFHRGEEFEEFYHMTIGKETSRHDFLVQRVIKDPYLFKNRKVDIRAFLLLMTLRHRRVLALVNPGFCRLASAEYKPFDGADEDEESTAEPLTPKKLREKQEANLQAKMEMLVCPYQTKKERIDRAKRMEENRLFTGEEDRSKKLDEVFRSESRLKGIKKQIAHIGMRLAAAIERKIWDAYGCYQIFGMDLCVDQNYKVWLLEVNSHAMSEVDLLSPTQRIFVPAMMMEALGLVMECMYKSSNGLRLRKSPYDEFKETGFLFGQNFQMVFSTLTRRRTDYVHPRPRKDNGLPFYERITVVDEQIKKTERRKKACSDMKQKLIDEKSALRKRRNEKDDEES